MKILKKLSSFTLAALATCVPLKALASDTSPAKPDFDFTNVIIGITNSPNDTSKDRGIINDAGFLQVNNLFHDRCSADFIAASEPDQNRQGQVKQVEHLIRGVLDCTYTPGGKLHLDVGRFGAFANGNTTNILGLDNFAQSPAVFAEFRELSPLFWIVFPNQDGVGTAYQMGNLAWSQHITWSDDKFLAMPGKSGNEPTYDQKLDWTDGGLFASAEWAKIGALNGQTRLALTAGLQHQLDQSGLTLYGEGVKVFMWGAPDAEEAAVGLVQPLNTNVDLKLDVSALKTYPGIPKAEDAGRPFGVATPSVDVKINNIWSASAGLRLGYGPRYQDRPATMTTTGFFIISAHL
jgi:hypothetical protein